VVFAKIEHLADETNNTSVAISGGFSDADHIQQRLN